MHMKGYLGMRKTSIGFAAAMALTLGAVVAIAAPAAPAQQAKAAEPAVSGNLVMFLTQIDPMSAGHGVHFATNMARSGRGAVIVLVGEAGRLALRDWPTPVSAVDGEALQTELKGFVNAGGKVYITPYTLRSFNASADDLIDGASPPDDPAAIHAHMFEPDTQLLVW